MVAVIDQSPRFLCGFGLLAVAFVLSGCGGIELPPGPAGNVTNATVSYFGCGCFWHVQHEMVVHADREIVGRSGSDITSFTGYAGGSGSEQGRVCYHNAAIQDYGNLGYAEVASIDLPEADIVAVAELFLTSVCIDGNRLDQGDRGSPYRSLVGFPGGIESAMGSAFKKVGESHGVTVVAGAGSDDDASGTVYVMDSTEFPFHQAEVYHQFHDDTIHPATGMYTDDYHGYQQSLLADGVLKRTGCPSDGVPVTDVAIV